MMIVIGILTQRLCGQRVRMVCGVWDRHSFWDKLHFTGTLNTSGFPKGSLPPFFFFAEPPVKRAKPAPKGAAQSIAVHRGDHVQEFKANWARNQKWDTEPVRFPRNMLVRCLN